MPRTKEFDTTQALDRAMHAFWRNGYHATSMDDLVASLGVQRYGIYAAFKSKHALFLAALDRYLATTVTDLLKDVEQPHAALLEIEAYLTQFVAIAATPVGQWGCLMCNTATELAPHDPVVADKVQAYLQRLTTAFRQALTNAQHRGELGHAVDIAASAQYLTGVVVGVSVYAKTPVARTAIAAYVHVALATLR